MDKMQEIQEVLLRIVKLEEHMRIQAIEREEERIRDRKEFDERMRLYDEQRKKDEEKREKSTEDMKRSIKEMSKEVGKITGSIGNEAENYFYIYFKSNKHFGNIKFDEIYKNQYSGDQESDIFLVNGNSFGLVSVKFKLKKQDIDDLVESELENVKKHSPFLTIGKDRFKNIYLGIASYSMDDSLVNYAMKKGIFVFTKKGDDVTMLNNGSFQAKTF